MGWGVLNFKEGDEVFMEVDHRLWLEDLGWDFIVLNGLFVQVDGKEDHDFIPL